MRTHQFQIDPPERRPLKIFAFDPMLASSSGGRVTIDIPNEKVAPGPVGSRIAVVDYDGAHDRYYPPVDLDDRALLMRGGLDPDESDPRFHQQMVYAVTMRVLENFEGALGRSLSLRRVRRGASLPLRIFPHAFHGANAFYDRDLHALLFGYFRADPTDPGPNLPGQNVFTCLSHDIIAHEMTHALVDRLKRHFLEPTNEDVLAFHEGFADVVALFQHFTFQDVVRDHIQKDRTGLRKESVLVDLARQFGYASGAGKALRSALGDPDRKLYTSLTEAHDRGAILVAAVFDAFFAVYQRRIRDLIRIATGGTGNLPDADLHPDLVSRVAQEASRTADAVLRMCIRAFDYLAPVDVQFGDYLRALVTADYELNPSDEFGLRGAMIESFRQRGIYPDGVANLAEESLLWPENPTGLPPLEVRGMSEVLTSIVDAASVFSRGKAAEDVRSRAESEEADEDSPSFYQQVHAYANANAIALGLIPNDPDRKIAVRGVHPIFRVGRNGRLLIEVVAEFTQQDTPQAGLGGLRFRGGATVVFTADGRPRYVVSKPLQSPKLSTEHNQAAEARLRKQVRYAELCALADPRFAWHEDGYEGRHMELRMNLAAVHAGAIR